MDPQIPTSFIPKRPVLAGVQPERQNSSRAVGLLSVLTAVVVVATIVSFAFVYFYERSLESQKVRLEGLISSARDGIGTDFLSDMKRLNARISGVKLLLDKHIVVTPIFEALQATTLRSVRYESFSYQFMNDPVTKSQVVQVTLKGIARNYSTIALQSDAFTQSSLIRNPVFSGLTVEDNAGGAVSFTLTFNVAPEDLSFASFIERTKASAAAAPAPTL